MNFIFIIINFVIFILIRIFMIFRSICLHDLLLYIICLVLGPIFVGCNVCDSSRRETVKIKNLLPFLDMNRIHT